MNINDYQQGAMRTSQIYNKSLEVKKHQKEWFEDIWRAHGWDGKSTVWRVEFRFKRSFERSIHREEEVVS